SFVDRAIAVAIRAITRFGRRRHRAHTRRVAPVTPLDARDARLGATGRARTQASRGPHRRARLGLARSTWATVVDATVGVVVDAVAAFFGARGKRAGVAALPEIDVLRARAEDTQQERRGESHAESLPAPRPIPE